MQHNFVRLVMALFFLLPFTLATAATETYTLDKNHSYVLWHISHFGFSNPSGKWYVQGTLALDDAKPQNSKVNITIPITDISTGLPELDKHLKTKSFFDAEQFPTATFVSDKVDVTSKTTANVHGVLTLRGVSKPVVLHVALNKMGMSPISNKMTAGFSATTDLKRSDFGMNEYLPGLGDKVAINIEIEAYKN